MEGEWLEVIEEGDADEWVKVRMGPWVLILGCGQWEDFSLAHKYLPRQSRNLSGREPGP